jgi:pimeloyl-ACP methyl ester carboxylesterase
LALVLALSACDKASNEGGDFPGGTGEKAVSIFDPLAASPQIPFPVDLLFAGFSDPTLNIPNPPTPPTNQPNPFVAAVNQLDGWSTTASLFTDVAGFVDFDTVPSALTIIDTSTSPPTPLVPGVDFRVQSSTAIDPLDNRPISDKRSRILIEPLKPLKPSTTYVVALSTAARALPVGGATEGEPVIPSDYFRVVRSSTPVSAQSEPVLAVLNDTQKATLEAIRRQLIPVMQLLAAFGKPADTVAIAWPFTTQSTQITLQRMAETAQPNVLRLRQAPAPVSEETPAGTVLTTTLLGLPGPAAQIYAGRLTLPYYLSAPTAENPAALLTGFWKADTSKTNLDGQFLGRVPCGAFAIGADLDEGPGVLTAKPSASTTVCYPLPLSQGNQTVPVIATVPVGTMPENGWPVVIFQHGITSNRSAVLGIVPALTAAGFAVISIDLPLHGILATDPRFAGLRNPDIPERTFDVDLVNNTTGAPNSASSPPDGPDSSGTHFINLSSLLTARDNIRQGVSDLLVLGKSLVPVAPANLADPVAPGTIFVSLAGAPQTALKFDTTQVRYVGHSLGAIVASTFLGVNSTTGAGVLAMPGGGIAKLLDASAAFGPRISAGLAAASGGLIAQGNDTYETILRFAQTVVDSGDPLNFATATATNHPIYMIEVVGDAVVPNCAIKNDPACPVTDVLPISGYLSGTTPLARVMGLSFQPSETGAITVPTTANVLTGAAARNNVVRFSGTQAEHSTILTPDSSANPGSDSLFLPALSEMQKQAASFLRSNGTCLPIGGTCPEPPAAVAD